MKTLLTLIFLLIAGVVQAETVTLQWNSNKETDLLNYRVYARSSGQSDYGPATGLATGPSFTTTTLAPGLWYFTITAVDTTGNESKRSNEVSWVVFPTQASPIVDPRIATLEAAITAMKKSLAEASR